MAREYFAWGPPGCGKTHFAKDQLGKWARDYGPEHVLACSFTRTAATELRSRDLAIPEANCRTVHSHAFRELGGNLKIADTPEHLKLWNEEHPTSALSHSVFDMDDGLRDVGNDEAARNFAEMNIWRNRHVPIEQWPSRNVRVFARAWEAWKHEHDLVDFTDLLELAIENTSTPRDAEAIVVDEAQDLTPLQLELVHHWSAGVDKVLYVGDDDQCLFEFTGARAETLLDMAEAVPADQRKVLPVSFRVPRAVHAVADKWVHQLSRRYDKVWTARDHPGSIRHDQGARLKHPSTVLRNHIEPALSEGKTIMVIAATHFLLGPLVKLLREEGVPFHNPYNGSYSPLGAAHPKAGRTRRTSSRARLLAFLRTQPSTWGDDHRWYTVDDVRTWMSALKVVPTFMPQRDKLLDGLPGGLEFDADYFVDELLRGDDETVERNLTAIMGADLKWFEDRLLKQYEKSMAYPLNIVRKRGGAALRDEPSVILGTIHSVKGGEADVVAICPDIALPSYKAIEKAPNGESRDSLMRMFYVALTRARESVVVLSANNDTISVGPQSLSRGVFLV